MAHIIINPLIHYTIINPAEKQAVRTLSGDAIWAKRPTGEPYGMPSGHAETAAVLAYLMYKKGLINGWACAAIITLIGLQRIVYNRHTLLQVIVGTCLGLLYAHIYATSENPILKCLLIAIAWMI
jgi:membrane-associated phospholipid phosphatase